jgi:hypothetical protein
MLNRAVICFSIRFCRMVLASAFSMLSEMRSEYSAIVRRGGIGSAFVLGFFMFLAFEQVGVGAESLANTSSSCGESSGEARLRQGGRRGPFGRLTSASLRAGRAFASLREGERSGRRPNPTVARW